MPRARRAYRWWHVRRTLVLSLSVLAVVGLAAAQALRLKESFAVYGVTVLVTAQIGLILGFLLLRHFRRQAPRESAVAAILGVCSAALLTALAPALAPQPVPHAAGVVVVPAVFEEPAPTAPPLATAVRVPDFEPPQEQPREEPPAPRPEAAPPPDSRPPAQGKLPAGPARAEPAPIDVAQPRPDSDAPELEQHRRLLEESTSPRARRQERELNEQFLRRGLPSEAAPRELPPPHVGVSLYLGHLIGRVGMSADASAPEAPLDELMGNETFQTAGELMAEFPLSLREVLRVSTAGLLTIEKGILGRDIATGSGVLAEGSPFTFDLQWAHTFVGFGHRFAGYTRESRFDFAGHVGVMVDHLSAMLRSGGPEEEFGSADTWSAAAAGFTLGMWDTGRGGLVVEVLQSVPVNIAGQTISLTDVRLVIQHDFSDTFSIMIGYRRIVASYLTFDKSLTRSGETTHSALDVGGPVAGLDVRF